jgi:hypothetical protein
LYDEAWALLASPHGQNLLIEGVRDGRKHNGAIWLASQHPNDFAISELEDLLGSRFVFRQAHRAIPAALRFLGVTDSVDAAVTLEQGLATGVCLYRDVRDRVGLIQVLPPTVPDVDHVFNTAPTARGHDPAEPDDEPELPEGAVRAITPPDGDEPQAVEPGPSFDDLEDDGQAADGPDDDVADAEREPAAIVPEVLTTVAPEHLSVDPREAAAIARQRAQRRRRTPLAEALADRDGS